MSAVRYPLALENCQIFFEGQCENTFYYVCRLCNETKVVKISP